MLHVLPNIPCKNHNAATSGVQPDKRTAAHSNTLQQIERRGGSRLRGCTGSLHRLPPLGFPPGLSSLPPPSMALLRVFLLLLMFLYSPQTEPKAPFN